MPVNIEYMLPLLTSYRQHQNTTSYRQRKKQRHVDNIKLHCT